MPDNPSGHSAEADPLAVIDRLEAMWNTQRLEAVLSLFTDQAVLKILPPPPGKSGCYTGKVQLQPFLQSQIADSHVWFRSHHYANDHLIWMAKLSSPYFRQRGLDPVECRGEAIIETGKITHLTVTLLPEMVAKLRASRAPS